MGRSVEEERKNLSRVQEDEVVEVIVVPFPAQGHINPLLQFAKHLLAHHPSLKITLPLILTKNANNHSTVTQYQTLTPSLTIHHIPLLPYQGLDHPDQRVFWERRQAAIRSHLTHLLTSNPNIACVVYDAAFPWVIDIVKQFGVSSAAFFTQSCAVNSIYYNVYKGWLGVPLEQCSISLDGLPPLCPSDFPSFVYDPLKYPDILNMLSDQFARLDEADWIFTNTFDSLEPQEVKWMEGKFAMKNIGPMVPSMYLDGRLENDKDYGVSMFEPNKNKDLTMKWLDSKHHKSVIYVSFGSGAELEKEQMEELACALKRTNKYFLWVVRESEVHKLPQNFIEDHEDAAGDQKGLVVNWCCQLQVLAHKSVGCFVTHCGWNSTLEALSLGVPLVTMAQWSDQPTNAKYVEDVWRVGKRVRLREEDNGMCRREEIEKCVNEVMEEGEVGEEIRKRLRKWRELAKEAMDDGGTSHANIIHFLQQLLNKTN
ncbi:UDP-glycosyltransferase 74E2-like [Cucumis sativus]|uniref:UDP-glycosyltransferase 74E2-like n=1 Tax=Cucumis sativus TaxID=3659 RepID=UPI0012F4EEE6|nr:UDP-glycosyltransferase 74E2-like [Cucumis sativus]